MSKVNSGSFFLQWVTAVTVTMILAVMAAFASMWSVGEWVMRAWGDTAGSIVTGAIFGALLGVGVGLGQAIVLRSYGVPFMHWLGRTVLAGAVGMAITFTLMFSFFDNVPDVVAGLAIALSVGPPIGLAQWPMLKPHVAQAQLWAPILTVAFFIGFTVGLPLSGEWLSLGVVALLTAVLSGAGMVWLARGGETAVTA